MASAPRAASAASGTAEADDVHPKKADSVIPPKTLPPGAINWSVEFLRIWGPDYSAWNPDQPWWEQEALTKHEACILSAVLAATTHAQPTVRLPVSFLARAARICPRAAYRALAVLCDPNKAGVLARPEPRRSKASGGGRFDVGEFTPVPARLAWLAGLKARPSHWDDSALNHRSNTAPGAHGGGPGTAHRDAVRAALLEAGLPEDQDTGLHYLRAAERADRAAFWLARAEVNATLREESRRKRALAAEKAEAEVREALAQILAKAAERTRSLPTLVPELPTTTAPTTAAPVVDRDTKPEDISQIIARDPVHNNLISVVSRWANAGYRWAIGAREHILKRGGRITDAERETAGELLLREARGEKPNAGGGKPSHRGRGGGRMQVGGWRPKGS